MIDLALQPIPLPEHKPLAIELPQHVDSTMVSCARSCLHKFYEEFVLGLRPASVSIDLHAGGCFADAIEAVARETYTAGAPLDTALARALGRYMNSWGNVVPLKDTPKTKDRVWEAVEEYFKMWPPLTDHVQPYRNPDGTPAYEFTFAIPLEPACYPEDHERLEADGIFPFPTHPSGDPFIYAGRFDLLGMWANRPVVRDEKTTTSIGAKWAEQWDLRCFDAETEVLTPYGWKPIPSIKEGDVVLQVSETGEASWASTRDVHRAVASEMIQIEGRAISQLVTPNHRLLLNKRRGGTAIVRAEQLLWQDGRSSIPTSTTTLVTKTDKLVPALQRYLVAVQADGALRESKRLAATVGNYPSLPVPSVSFSFKKERKTSRLLTILKELQVDYSKNEVGLARDEVYISGFEPVQRVGAEFLSSNKEFSWKLLDKLDETFLLELRHWDGNGRQYYTASEHNARFVQTLAHLWGWRASVALTHGKHWVVVLSRQTTPTLSSLHVRRLKAATEVFCLQVETGLLLVRRQGRISVSGNSQFLGYCWACQQSGLPVDTCIVRGIGILKTKFHFVEAIKTYPQWLIERWHEQLRRDLWRIRRAWDEGYWDWNLAESCTMYGGCPFAGVCTSQHPERWRSNYVVRRWNPLLKNPIVESV